MTTVEPMGKPPKDGVWTLKDPAWPRVCEVQLDRVAWVAMCSAGGGFEDPGDGTLSCRACGVVIDREGVNFP